MWWRKAAQPQQISGGEEKIVRADGDSGSVFAVVFSLIGPNGAGKSTTIKAIMGLLPVMDGKIEFAGTRKNFTYIPEQPVLYEGLTLWEHLELAAAAYEIERNVFVPRAEELLKLFRLTEVKHHIPGSFSKGMQQKVMLIVGFLLEPSAFVVDE